jgi:glycosyltransferase involved in cell wall biosynthesis
VGRTRFLFVTQYHLSRATGGAEQQCWLLATEFARRGYDVHYASEMNRLPDPSLVEGVELHGLPEDPPWWTGNRLPLRQLMDKLRPDVVYNQVFNIYAGHAMLEAPPHAATVWAAAASGDGLLWRYLAEAWKIHPPVGFLKRLPEVLYTRFVALKGVRKASLVLAQHGAQHEQFRRIGVESVILRNSHPPVGQTEVQTHEGTPTVLWVGSIKRWKRPELFIELARRCEDLPATFLMIGNIWDMHYRAPVEKTGLEVKNFRYGGFVPVREVQKYFREAHVFISTSVSEGFPNTFVHAWARGVPVVSLDVDPDNLLEEHGLGVKVSSLDHMEAEVRSLVADPERRRTIGTRARSFAIREFDLEANVDRLEGLLADRGVKLRAE